MAKVLIVDDESSYLHYISAHLVREGHEVETAASGEEGIRVGFTFAPDLLIADWLLEDDGAGIRVAEVLRQRNPALRTILITGFSSEQVREKAASSHVFCYVEKPFDMDELAGAVREALATGLPGD